MSLKIIGIDPGLEGATVMVDTVAKQIAYIPHSEILKSADFINGLSYLSACKKMVDAVGEGVADTVILEMVITLSRNQGIKTVAANWGVIKAVWDILGFKILAVAPNVWKGIMVGKDLARRYGKQSSVLVCQKKGYVIPTSRPAGKKLHDGIADAILMAEWGEMKLRSMEK